MNNFSRYEMNKDEVSKYAFYVCLCILLSLTFLLIPYQNRPTGNMQLVGVSECVSEVLMPINGTLFPLCMESRIRITLAREYERKNLMGFEWKSYSTD